MINELRELEPEIKRKFDLTLSQIRQEKRTAKLCKARAYVYHLLYNKYDYTLQDIADEFNKNHSSVINALNNFDSYGLSDDDSKNKNILIEELKKEKSILYLKIKSIESILDLYNK